MRSVEKAILKYDHRPLSGNAPAFPWEALRESLEKQFDLELVFEVHTPDWKNEMEGGGFFLEFPPIGQCVALQVDEKALTRLLLKADEYAAALEQEGIGKDFAEFCVAEAMRACKGFPAFRMVEAAEMKGPFLVCAFAVNGVSCRLVVPKAFHEAWVAHFASEPAKVSPEMQERLNVRLGVEIGRADLSIESWESVKVGDFVALDECHFDLESGEGDVELQVAGVTVGKGKLTSEGVVVG